MAQPAVGVDERVDPAQSTPKGRFALRADSIRPYSWRVRSSNRSIIAPGFNPGVVTGRVRALVYRYKVGNVSVCGTAFPLPRFLNCLVTGRVRAPTYWYKPRSVIVCRH